jgi:hypothetical protein
MIYSRAIFRRTKQLLQICFSTDCIRLVDHKEYSGQESTLVVEIYHPRKRHKGNKYEFLEQTQLEYGGCNIDPETFG